MISKHCVKENFALMIRLDGDFGVKISLRYVGHTLYCQYDTKWIIWDGRSQRFEKSDFSLKSLP